MKIIEIEDLRQLGAARRGNPKYAHFISILRKLQEENRTLRERTEMLDRLHKHLKKDDYVISGECHEILLTGKQGE